MWYQQHRMYIWLYISFLKFCFLAWNDQGWSTWRRACEASKNFKFPSFRLHSSVDWNYYESTTRRARNQFVKRRQTSQLGRWWFSHEDWRHVWASQSDRNFNWLLWVWQPDHDVNERCRVSYEWESKAPQEWQGLRLIRKDDSKTWVGCSRSLQGKQSQFDPSLFKDKVNLSSAILVLIYFEYFWLWKRTFEFSKTLWYRSISDALL